MVTVTSRLTPASDLARTVLRVDAAVSATSGVLVIAGARPISDFLGLTSAAGLVALGTVIMLPYAALLFMASNQRPIARRSVLLPAIGNVVWVIVSIALLVEGTPAFSTGGKWAVAVAADIVALIAVAQFVALRRMGRADT